MIRTIHSRFVAGAASLLFGLALRPLPDAMAAAAPANDVCAGAEVIPSAGPFPYLSPLIADVSSAATSGDPQIPVACVGSVPLSCSVWYKFTPAGPGASLYSFSTAGDTATTEFDTVLAIYTSAGGCAGPFGMVACADDGFSGTFLQASISRTLNPGTNYYIVVWNYGGMPPQPPYTALQLRVTKPTVPPNDLCSGASIIPPAGPFPYLTPVADITLATKTNEPAPSCVARFARSVWYQFTPSISATYILSTSNDTATTVSDTAMVLYSSANGCAGPLTSLACSGDTADCTSCGFRAGFSASLSAGSTYYIQVGETPQLANSPYSVGATSLQLRLSLATPPVVLTLPADSVSSTGVVLHAAVNPNSANTTAWFEWGATTNYGNQTPTQGLGVGVTALPLNEALSIPMPTNAYHFRVVATNAFGSTRGQDATFSRAMARPRITSFTHPPGGTFPVRFDGAAGQIYYILGSTDLVNWSPIGDATDLGNGKFEFIDIGDSGDTTRFYLIGSP